MKWQPGEARLGDMIRVRIGSIWHYGIFVSEEEVIAFGLPPVPEFRSDPLRETVCATDIDVFSCGKIVEISVLDRSERKKSCSPEQIVSRARSRLGQTGYDLIRNNCEHFAYECVFGEKRSLQQENAMRHWTERPICSVYLAEIPFPGQMQEIYPPERAAEIQDCSHPLLKQAKTANWLLLQYAARHCFSLDLRDLRFERSKNGKWSCDKFSFSLSHTDTVAAVAVSNTPVGVDIEALPSLADRFPPQRIEALWNRSFTRSERAMLLPEPESFLIGWTRKEAAFKQTGKGAFRPKDYDILNTRGLSCRIPALGELILSVCGDHADRPHIYYFDGIASRLLDPIILSL